MTSTHPTLADLDALAAEEPFVRALARSLLGGDPVAADDVVQQTWLEVIRRGAPDGEARRGWLARVVRTRASNLRRGEARRASRERDAARPEAVLGPDELLARAEQRRKVVEAVAELAEPYRTAVLLRYLEGLPPREIAARQGVPRDTVATRLKRALAMLRDRFDAEHGGDRSAWVAALAPFALPTRGAAVGSALVANLFGLVAGLSAMKHFLILVGAAVAVALFFSFLQPGDERPVVDLERTAAVPDRGAEVGAGGVGETAAAERTRREVTVVPGAAPTVEIDPLADAAARVVGRAVFADGSPAVERACRLWSFDPLTGLGGVQDPLGEPRTAGPSWEDAVTDEFGRFAFERVPPGGVHALWLAHDSIYATWRTLEQTPGAREVIDVGTVVLDLRAAITGAVVGPEGEPVAGAEVWAADLPGAVLGAAPFDRIEPDGALLIGLPDGEAEGASAWVERVRSHFATWLPQAEADAAFQVLPMPDWAQRFWQEMPLPRTVTDADGRFRLDGVAPGSNVLVVTAPGLENGGRTRVLVREGDVRDVGRVRLGAGNRMECRVVTAGGDAVPNAEVRVALRPRIGITGILFASAPRYADGEGRVGFDGLPRGEYVVAFRSGAGAPWAATGPVEAGESVELRLPTRHEVRVAVQRADGSAPEEVRVRLLQGPLLGEATATGFQSQLDPARHVADEGVDGGAHVVALRDLPPGIVTVVVAASGSAIETATFRVAEDAADRLEVVLRPAVSCPVEVVDAAERPVGGAEVWLSSSTESEEGWSGTLLMNYGGVERFRRMPREAGRTGRDGRVVVEHVPDGPASVIVRHPAFGITVAPVESPEDGVLVVLQRPGVIAGRLTENGAAPPEGRYEVVARAIADGSAASLPEFERRARPGPDGSFRFEGITPGAYRVSARPVETSRADTFGGLLGAMEPSWSWGIPLETSRRVDVRPGETAQLSFDADPLAPADGESGAPLRGRVALDGRGIAGAVVEARVPFDSFVALDHRIATTDADGRFARAEPMRRDGIDVRVTALDDAAGGDSGWRWTRRLDADVGAELSFEADAGHARLRAIGYDGLPAAGHAVRATGAPDAGGDLDAWATTGQDGTVVLVLPAGTYRVVIEGDRGDGVVEGLAVRGAVDRELRLTSAGVVAGRVDVGDPTTVTFVTMWAKDKSRFWMESPDDDGAFLFTNVPPGTYDLRLRLPTGSHFAEPRMLEVGPDGVVGLTLRVGPTDDDG